MPATELRVHLGEALRALETEDLVVEKGGVPVALLTRYDGTAYQLRKGGGDMTTNAAYEAALSKRGDAAAWPGTFAVMKLGWLEIDSDELVESIYKWRAAGTSNRVVELSEDDEGGGEDAEDGEVSPGYRLLHQRHETETRRIADERDGGYRA